MWEEKGKGTSFQGERTLSDESPALERAARWGSPSSLLGLFSLSPDTYVQIMTSSSTVLNVCLGGRGNPLVQLYFFHHDEDTGVKMEAWWPLWLKRSLRWDPGPNPPHLSIERACSHLLTFLHTHGLPSRKLYGCEVLWKQKCESFSFVAIDFVQ